MNHSPSVPEVFNLLEITGKGPNCCYFQRSDLKKYFAHTLTLANENYLLVETVSLSIFPWSEQRSVEEMIKRETIILVTRDWIWI
jgi:hypothetical protein